MFRSFIPSWTLSSFSSGRLFFLSLENWIFEILWKFFPQKATRFSIYLQSNRLCSLKMHSVSSAIQDQFLFLLDMFPSLGMGEKKPRKWQQPAPDHFDGSEDFFSELFFLDNGLRSQQGTVPILWNRIKFEGFTINFKGNKWLLCSKCLELDKRKRPWVWKFRSDTSNKGFP